MTDKKTEALQKALEVSEEFMADYQSEDGLNSMKHYANKHHAVITAIREALAEQPAQQEPVAWMPIEQMYPQAKAIDILMGDGSILCAVLPQFDGDLWWEGSGTGEKFIDPKYANVTHWRIHDERTSPPVSKPWVGLTNQELIDLTAIYSGAPLYCAIEAKLREKNA